jgi:uncharacterized cupin superfamily protein
MSLLQTITSSPEDLPKEISPSSERIVEGSPTFKVWRQDEDRDGAIRTGVWESTPGSFRVAKNATYEFCHIIHGKVELGEDGKDIVTYRAGDSFVMKPGFAGVWNTIEHVRKIFVTSD